MVLGFFRSQCLNLKNFYFESFLVISLHDFPHDMFSHCFFPWQLVNGLDHLGIGFPLVLQIIGLGIINVMLFGNPVQTVDPGISSFQTFLQLDPRSHVLIPRPMKLDASLSQPLLNVESQTPLLPSPSRLGFPLSHCPCHSPVFFSDLLVDTNFPNLWRVEVFLHRLFFLVWVVFLSSTVGGLLLLLL